MKGFSRTRRGTIPGLIGTVAVLAAACTTTGTPSAGSSSSVVPSSDVETSSSAVAPTSTATSSPLGQLDPCALLTQAELAALGFPPAGRRDDLAGLQRCIWINTELTTVRVVLDPERGIADTNNGSATKVEDVQVGRHAARRVEEPSGPGYCEFDVVVSENAHATVATIILNKTAEACALAQRAVTAVEPKLP